MSDPVQQIKDRLNIVDVVGRYVKLTRAGRNYKGLSPFRKEKSPSFFVNPEKGMYYDFSSGQGGDLFTFVQTMEGLDFKGALHMLADQAGVEVRHESKHSRDTRERLYVVLEDACQYFETKLTETPDVIQYLEDRGMERATMRSFRLGFAPDGWRNLSEFLTKKGYTPQELEQAGLAKRPEGKSEYYDRFRSRVMFPIMDPAGRVVAFSGRIFGEAAKDEKNAKYLNSPETALFDKGRILYGYDKAKNFIRKYDFSILVEGQMDIVLSHQAGYSNTVAVSGTGLTVEHLALLQRLSPKIVMAFDADSAGIASSGRAAGLALERGMDVKVASVPVGKDPADCIKEDKELWKRAIKESKHVIEFYLDIVGRENEVKGGDRRRLALAVRDTVLPYVARIQSGVDQAHFVRLVVERIGLAEDAVWQDVRAHAQKLRDDAKRVAIHAPDEQQTKQPPKPMSTRREMLERGLAGFLFWQESLEPRILEEEHVRDKATTLSVELESILARHLDTKDMLAFEAEITHADATDPLELLDDLMRATARELLREEREDLSHRLKSAEMAHDEKEASALLARFHELARSIEALERRN
jgi:DNA primase